MKKTVTLMLITLFLLSGCSRIDQQTPGKPKVVTKITADYFSGSVTLQRAYTDAEKMQAVLTYLRCLRPFGAAETDPETADGSRVHITLYYSDNTTKIYQQRADQYLRVDNGVWQNILPERGRELALLLGLMESDL